MIRRERKVGEVKRTDKLCKEKQCANMLLDINGEMVSFVLSSAALHARALVPFLNCCRCLVGRFHLQKNAWDQ